jgi:hypothetical protein
MLSGLLVSEEYAVVRLSTHISATARLVYTTYAVTCSSVPHLLSTVTLPGTCLKLKGLCNEIDM